MGILWRFLPIAASVQSVGKDLRNTIKVVGTFATRADGFCGPSTNVLVWLSMKMSLTF